MPILKEVDFDMPYVKNEDVVKQIMIENELTENEATKNALTGKEQRTILMRLLKYLAPHKKSVAIAFLLLVLTVIGDVLGPYIIKVFIDDHLAVRNFEKEPLLFLAITYMGIQILNVVITYLQSIKFQQIALKIIQQLRIDVFGKIHQLGMRYFDRVPAGSIVSRATNDTEAIKDLFVSVLISFVGVVLFVGLSFILYVYLFAYVQAA